MSLQAGTHLSPYEIIAPLGAGGMTGRINTCRDTLIIRAELVDVATNRQRWDELKSALLSGYEPIAEDWVFSGQNWGWALRLKHKKRAILYLTPCKGHFLVGLVLGEKAVKAARRSDVPAAIMHEIDAAKKYAEGRAVRIAVKTKKDTKTVENLAAIKMAN